MKRKVRSATHWREEEEEGEPMRKIARRVLCGEGGNGRVWIDMADPTLVVKADEISPEAQAAVLAAATASPSSPSSSEKDDEEELKVSEDEVRMATASAAVDDGQIPSPSFLIEVAMARRLGLPLRGIRWHWVTQRGRSSPTPQMHLLWPRYEPLFGQEQPPTSWRMCDLQRLREFITDIIVQLARAHASGVVHGDLSPENFLLDVERAVVIDWGAAYLEHAPILGMGKASYRAPELWADDEGVVRAASKRAVDIWALGITVVQWLTGKCPLLPLNGLERAEVEQGFRTLAADQPKWLSQCIPDAIKRRDPTLWDWLTLALHTDPKCRGTAPQLLHHAFAVPNRIPPAATVPRPPSPPTLASSTFALPESVVQWIKRICDELDLNVPTLDNAQRLVVAYASAKAKRQKRSAKGYMIADDNGTALVVTAAVLISDILFATEPVINQRHLAHCKPVLRVRERRQKGKLVSRAMDDAAREASMPALERCIRDILTTLDGHLIYI
jgi:hypothetical protein